MYTRIATQGAFSKQSSPLLSEVRRIMRLRARNKMTPTANGDPGESASSALSGMLPPSPSATARPASRPRCSARAQAGDGPRGRLRVPSGGLLESSSVSSFSWRLNFVTRSWAFGLLYRTDL